MPAWRAVPGGPGLSWGLSLLQILTGSGMTWNKSSATLLSCDNRKVTHMEYSRGTAAHPRGTKELGEGQHFWEIKMTPPVYGTTW